MNTLETIVTDTYSYGKAGVLHAGELFRATGGDVYELDNGTQVPFAETGTFTFLRYCEGDGRRWIEATRPDERTVHRLYIVKRSARSRLNPSIIHRPYRVKKFRRKPR